MRRGNPTPQAALDPLATIPHGADAEQPYKTPGGGIPAVNTVEGFAIEPVGETIDLMSSEAIASLALASRACSSRISPSNSTRIADAERRKAHGPNDPCAFR